MPLECDKLKFVRFTSDDFHILHYSSLCLRMTITMKVSNHRMSVIVVVKVTIIYDFIVRLVVASPRSHPIIKPSIYNQVGQFAGLALCLFSMLWHHCWAGGYEGTFRHHDFHVVAVFTLVFEDYSCTTMVLEELQGDRPTSSVHPFRVRDL